MEDVAVPGGIHSSLTRYHLQSPPQASEAIAAKLVSKFSLSLQCVSHKSHKTIVLKSHECTNCLPFVYSQKISHQQSRLGRLHQLIGRAQPAPDRTTSASWCWTKATKPWSLNWFFRLCKTSPKLCLQGSLHRSIAQELPAALAL